jgi:hypothetical protein
MAGAIVILGYYVAFFTYFWHYVNGSINKKMYTKMCRAAGAT